MAKKTSDLLTLEDVAFLYDGLRDDLPAGLGERLSRWVRHDPQFAEQIRRLQSTAAEARLPADRENRLTEALELERDLERLLAAGDQWQDPAEVLDPDGGEGVDLTGLVHLARSAERRPDPPDGIGKVRGKLVQALEEAMLETALVETFVQGLLERPARADGLLREARQGFAALSTARARNQ